MSEWDEWLTGRPAPTAPAVQGAEPAWTPAAETPWLAHDGGPKPNWLKDEAVVVNLTVRERDSQHHMPFRMQAKEVNWALTVAWRFA